MSFAFPVVRRFAAVAGLALTVALPLTAHAGQTPTAPPALPLSSAPPKGAIILFSGKDAELSDLWLKRYSKDPSGWKSVNGVATPANKSDIQTKQEFGDCFLHVEFKTPTDGDGNSGIGLQGRFEVQIFNTFGKELESHNGGAFYSQKAAKYNPSKAAGEWQSYDILFRAARFNDKGEVTEKPRATVIWNGVIVQNNEEFPDMTGIQYGEYQKITPTGPIVLQGDHSPVQYRNVWVLPL